MLVANDAAVEIIIHSVLWETPWFCEFSGRNKQASGREWEGVDEQLVPDRKGAEVGLLLWAGNGQMSGRAQLEVPLVEGS